MSYIFLVDSLNKDLIRIMLNPRINNKKKHIVYSKTIKNFPQIVSSMGSSFLFIMVWIRYGLVECMSLKLLIVMGAIVHLFNFCRFLQINATDCNTSSVTITLI